MNKEGFKMPIIGSNLKEMHFKRFDLKAKTLKLGRVKSDVKITDLSERDTRVLGFAKAIVFDFEFSVDYELEKPAKKKLGEIKIAGEILYVEDEKTHKKILSEWKKGKKIDSELIRNLVSSAMDITQVEAIYFAKKIMLPPPIPLPKLKFSDKKQDYIG
jgi:hypothetical protein